MRIRTLVVSSLLIFLIAALTHGQTSSAIVRAKIPFSFVIGKQTLPAGQYEFVPSQRPEGMKVISLDQKPEVFMPLITRLAAKTHSTPSDSHIVFDKVGDVYTLSEIWVPGEDGFLFHATKGKHEHHIIDIPKK